MDNKAFSAPFKSPLELFGLLLIYFHGQLLPGSSLTGRRCASGVSLPWVKLVDDALEPDHREKSGAESGQAGQEENAKGE